jgi:hypothetical protein
MTPTCTETRPTPAFGERAAFAHVVLFLFALICASGVASAQVTTLHLNEIESSGGVPDDWFELVNVGATPIDISGWKMLDNDDTHTPYVFPAGTTIAAGAYLVVDTGATGFSFGLGSADSARIFTPAGVLYESYSWTAHAATTYGRCPDGTGPFVTTTSSTKGTANDCSSPVRLNEVESNGGVPDDWFELYNPGAIPWDISGWKMLDNDDTHVPYVFPAGTVMAPGAFLVVDTGATGFNFGLGSADSVRIFDSANNLIDSYTWTTHATTTYGRCPDGTGPFVTTAASTKGTANSCGSAATSSVKLNEVESDGGVPDDWFELYNTGATPADISGWKMLDNDDTHAPYVFPAGTVMAPGAFLVVDTGVNGFSFGLGSADSVRIFDASGTLVDSYSWTAHAATTYGRCPDGTGAFVTTLASTKGTANSCASAGPSFAPWPGGSSISIADGDNVFGQNLSGLDYEGSGTSAPGVMWAIRNGPSTLYRLIFDGAIWTPDTTNGWSAGKTIFFPGGVGAPDSEGVTFAGTSSNGIYVSIERDNNNNSVSRNSVLRFDPSAPGTTLTATHDWNLTSDLPANGPNLGAEAIAWVPDTFLTASKFFDNAKGHIYNPAEYPHHGDGLFFVGIEASGHVYSYALDHSGNGAFTRLAELVTGFTGVMDLSFDRALGNLWAVCDDTCQGRQVVFRIDSTGKFVVAGGFERPSGMPNLNNEGFTITPLSYCAGNLRPVFWSDDTNDDGHAIRQGTLPCSQVVTFPDTLPPTAASVRSPAPNAAGWNSSDVTVTWNWSDDPGGSGINAANCVMSSTSSGEGTIPLTATCHDVAGNTGTATVTVKVDKTNPTIVATAKNADGSTYNFGDVSTQTVTVHYACADGGSLIASCTSDQVFANDGTFSTSGTASDNAGRSASSGALLVKIDRASSSPILSAVITNKTGAANARAWTLTISNLGQVAAANAVLNTFTLTQTSGAACTPLIAGPFPVAVAPSIAAAGSANAVVTIDFSSCSALARFTNSATFSSNVGAATGTMTLFNQLR